MIHISSRADNDLVAVLGQFGIAAERYDSPAQAVNAASDGASVMLLADNYPEKAQELPDDLWDTTERKKLRVYVEYPAGLPGIDTGEPRTTFWERGVVSSDMFSPPLEKMRLLAIHGCRFIPVQTEHPHIVVARVAGFDHAEFGLADTEAHPILFEHPTRSLLVATTKLSQFVTARYAPFDAWRSIWSGIIKWLGPDADLGALTWVPAVRPTYDAGDQPTEDAEIDAVRRGKAWYRKAKLYIHADWAQEAESRLEASRSDAEPDYGKDGGPPVDERWEAGDGRFGMIEGPSSRIDSKGRQAIRYFIRADCNGEAAMAEAVAGLACQGASGKSISSNLLDFLYFNSNMAQGPRADPQSSSYGLLRWDTVDGAGRYYGDDNARAMLGTMATAAAVNSDRWDEPLLRCLLANLRTTGPQGFRSGCLGENEIQTNGWRHFWETERTNIAPHYESWLWACFLWAYDKTGFTPFLDRARSAISITMAGYPHEWIWTNGLQQERARMLLPLAWLVRADDTEEHRQWLRFMAQELLAHQDPCGAIREEIGLQGKGRYGPPKSNAGYGTAEAPLIQNNGDPLCDLLYTTNFAFAGLREASLATGEELYREAEDQLAHFLCRIQVSSTTRPELDGAWFRAFDYKGWEYWASNADLGWGAWCVESGWTQGWITTVLALRQLNTSLWDLTSDSMIAEHFEKYCKLMFPECGGSSS